MDNFFFKNIFFNLLMRYCENFRVTTTLIEEWRV